MVAVFAPFAACSIQAYATPARATPVDGSPVRVMFDAIDARYVFRLPLVSRRPLLDSTSTAAERQAALGCECRRVASCARSEWLSFIFSAVDSKTDAALVTPPTAAPR